MVVTIAVNLYVIRYETRAAARLDSEVLLADALHLVVGFGLLAADAGVEESLLDGCEVGVVSCSPLLSLSEAETAVELVVRQLDEGLKIGNSLRVGSRKLKPAGA